MTDGPAIRTEGLNKHYGNLHALIDLDLEIATGEIFGYLGPNGAGKTTTIRTILDLIRPTSGKATILGLDSHADSIEIHRQTGYLPGDLALYPNLTGHELLTYFANLRGGVDWSWVQELAERLASDLTRKIGEYSTGNRQKIGVIQAFMHRPELLILDEPSTGLDPLVQQEFHKLLAETAAHGGTVFLSSHTLSEVERIADRVGIIRKGQLVVVETIDNLKAKAIRTLRLTFDAPVPTDIFDGVPGVRTAVVDGPHAQVSFEGPMDGLLQVATRHGVVDLNSVDADLEEIFLTYYRDQA
jgi:beta-exotoxin I transport system ATP-binding protein